MRYWASGQKLCVSCPTIGLRQPRIAGQTTVKELDSLNLTCDAVSDPPSVVTWAKVGWTETADILLVTGEQKADLSIAMVTGEHSGRYRCTARNLSKTLTSFVDVTVIENSTGKYIKNVFHSLITAIPINLLTLKIVPH